MRYNKSTHALNVDVHWLSFTRVDLMLALSKLSGQSIPDDGSVRIELDDDGDLSLEWQTPKVQP